MSNNKKNKDEEKIVDYEEKKKKSWLRRKWPWFLLLLLIPLVYFLFFWNKDKDDETIPGAYTILTVSEPFTGANDPLTYREMRMVHKKIDPLVIAARKVNTYSARASAYDDGHLREGDAFEDHYYKGIESLCGRIIHEAETAKKIDVVTSVDSLLVACDAFIDFIEECDDIPAFTEKRFLEAKDAFEKQAATISADPDELFK